MTEKKALLAIARKCLRGRYMTVFAMEIDGIPYTEIAKNLGVSVETVRLDRDKARSIFLDYVDNALHVEFLTDQKEKLEAEIKALKTLKGDKKIDPRLIMPISGVQFSVRTTNVLQEILPLNSTVADLVALIEKKGFGYLMNVRNCGKKTIEELENFIKNLDYDKV